MGSRRVTYTNRSYMLQAQRKLILGGREVTLAQQYAAIAVGSIPLYVIAGAGMVLYEYLQSEKDNKI